MLLGLLATLLHPALALSARESSPRSVWLAQFQRSGPGPADLQLEGLLQAELAVALQQRGFIVERGQLPLAQAPAGEGMAIGGYYRRSAAGRLHLFGLIADRQSQRIVDGASRSSVLDLPGADQALGRVRGELEESDTESIRRFAERVARQAALNPELRLRRDNLLAHSPEDAREDLSGFWPGEQEAGDAAREAFELLENQKVVTATRSQRTLRQSPAAVYVVTERQIRERGYRTLVDALHDIPGFDIIHTYGIFPELVHPRGLVGNNQRTLIYIDGILDNNISERATLGGSLRYPLFNVERIEVVMGPSSALYGANAFGGVIQVFTKGGDTAPGGDAEVGYGRYLDAGYAPGAYGAVAGRGRSSDSDMHYSAAGWFFSSRGPYFGDRQSLRSKSVNENDPRWQLEKEACGGPCVIPSDAIGYDWSPYYNASQEESYNLSARLQAGGFSLRTVNWQHVQADGTFANGSNLVDTDQLGFQRSGWNFRNNAAALAYDWNIASAASLNSEIAVRHTELLGSSRDVTVNRAPDPLFYYDLNRSGDFKLNENYSRADYSLEWREKLEWNISRRLQTLAGVEAVQESTPRDYGAAKRYVFSTYAGYLQAQFLPIDMLEVLIGYRYDFNTNYGQAHTPRVGLTLSPAGWLTLRAMASTGFRAPTPWELFNETAQRRANPDLQPEQMRSYELGAGLRFLRDYYLQFTFYRNEISDLLLEAQASALPRPEGGYYNQNQNVGRARIVGAEAQLDARPLESINVALGYSYNRGFYFDLPLGQAAPLSTRGRPGDDLLRDYIGAATGTRPGDERGDIPNIAPHRVFVGLTWRPILDLSLHLRANYADIRRTIASNPEKTVAGYLLLQLNIRYENLFGLQGWYASLLLRNAGDVSAYDPGIRNATGDYYPTRHPIEERNIWLSLGYKF
ncbi:MAG: TonB-dependent receptor [Leptospirales bacterium]|nr:TonB-dependent receptor [Leptospirales bacterium]